MGEKTGIAWTDHTFNIAWGCVKVSPGCKNCYAEELSGRFGDNVWGAQADRKTFGAKHWAEPLKWNRAAEKVGKPARVFCSSMCDIFEAHITIDRERERLWPLIRATPWLTWQLLTKRADRIAANLPPDWSLRGPGYPNVWLGVSIENMDYEWRANELRSVQARQRFISYEPALGPLDNLDLRGIDWLIYGGESGPNYRPAPVEWARGIRDRCTQAGVAFFHKQSSGPKPGTGVELDGQIWHQFPEVTA